MTLVFYVYYKVAPEAESSARELAHTLLARISDQSGIRGKLLRRRDDPSTWMEVYEGVPDGTEFEAALTKVAGSLGFLDVLKAGTTRRLEIFQAL